MSKRRKKKIGYKILKIIWFIFGGLIAFWTITWAINMNSIHGLGIIGAMLLFIIGIYGLIIFGAITLLFILIKWIVKKIKHKKKK